MGDDADEVLKKLQDKIDKLEELSNKYKDRYKYLLKLLKIRNKKNLKYKKNLEKVNEMLKRIDNLMNKMDEKLNKVDELEKEIRELRRKVINIENRLKVLEYIYKE